MDITGLTNGHINYRCARSQHLREQQLVLDIAIVELGETTDFVEIPLGRLALVIRQIRC